MARIRAGKSYEMDNDLILKINSPKVKTQGPYVVVHSNRCERWAIVALDWDKKPVLGIRWFWGTIGNPQSTRSSTWFVVPSIMAYANLDALPLHSEFARDIKVFLMGGMKGKDLKKKWHTS